MIQVQCKAPQNHIAVSGIQFESLFLDPFECAMLVSVP